MKLRMPAKLGDKNPKPNLAIFITNTSPGGNWKDQGYHRFGGG
jgi:DMSO/TMAO reductase YedYZ molybdopterin-dependent catalytic subunit